MKSAEAVDILSVSDMQFSKSQMSYESEEEEEMEDSNKSSSL